MGSHKQFKYLYGVLLRDICFLMRIPKSKTKQASKELHEALKEYANIDTLTRLNTRQMEAYLAMIRMLFAREYKGWFLKEPNEPEDIDSWDMHRFLQYKLYNRTI